jgi:guanylate kinase
MRKMKEKLIIVSAPSGAGKSTIVKHLLNTFPDFAFSVSATSRPIRKGEVDGREYFFMTSDEFRKKIESGELLEWQEVYPDSYYGTLKNEVDRMLKLKQVPVFDVDVVGGLNIKKMYGEKALAIFVQPPSLHELENRLRNRGTESEESLQKRIAKAAWEMEFAPKFDVIVINDLLENAFTSVEKAVSGFLKH